MKLLLTGLSALLCASTIIASDPAQRLQKRLQNKGPVIPKAQAPKPIERSSLQKRASRFLNENTQSQLFYSDRITMVANIKNRICSQWHWHT